ncbi:chemotaxis protein CheR [Pseudomonas cavernae]|uniref:Chemotaxis protein methyltransferase n=1 Tax=Pseudomonas cavernae TaxID=2320867 RepID=A0A385Z0L7_9PSED|nr:CheR family methyltransferase [Pseudomonas cavernae]AYC32586.1 chemotaxis protein CheR [Pseudomonas cavernae]
MSSSAIIGAHEFGYTLEDFERVRRLLYQKAGISLAPSKAQMVYSRLARRLRCLQLCSFSEYLAFLERHSEEWQQFVNALTTNLTAFFRESHHFDQLATLARLRAKEGRPLRFWSAASSTGEEPYSMAMTLVEVFGSFAAPVQIIASDIDTGVLDYARQGIYPEERVAQLAPALKQRFLQRGTASNAGKVRVVPELRQLVEFRQINLLEANWGIPGGLDAIFCRNVMIYFDKPTQARLLERMVRLLRPDGLFFAGHSESFMHASHVVKLVSRSAYQPVLAVHA